MVIAPREKTREKEEAIDKNGDPNGKKMWSDALGLSYLGIFFGVSIVIGYLGGAWADRRFHTAPWLSIVGLLLGIAAGFKELLRIAAQYRRKQQAADEKARRAAQQTRAPGKEDSTP